MFDVWFSGRRSCPSDDAKTVEPDCGVGKAKTKKKKASLALSSGKNLG